MGDAYRFAATTRTSAEQRHSEKTNTFIDELTGEMSGYELMANFPLATSRQDINRYLTRYEIFKKILDVPGTIIEGGCLFGGGLMWWAQLSAIQESHNHLRRICGFDSFDGIPEGQADGADEGSETGGFAIDSSELIQKSIGLYDSNRPIGHIPRVEIVKGDACKTIPQYTLDHPELLVSLLVLDFDTYAPTFVALENFLPLMAPGSVLAFDEICNTRWPGETQAYYNALKDVGYKVRLKRLPWGSTMVYGVVE